MKTILYTIYFYPELGSSLIPMVYADYRGPNQCREKVLIWHHENLLYRDVNLLNKTLCELSLSCYLETWCYIRAVFRGNGWGIGQSRSIEQLPYQKII